jgi:hypothetical protein
LALAVPLSRLTPLVGGGSAFFVRPLERMKTILVLIILVGVAVGCSPRAPVMKRVSSYDQIDEHYLKDVFAPNYTGSKLQLSNSVSQLEIHWAEFRDFMHQVEVGKIPVTQGFKGNWQSFVRQDGAWTAAGYYERLGVVVDFQKHKDQNPYPLIYSFRFSTNGTLTWADTMDDLFKFDEHGKVIEYWHK